VTAAAAVLSVWRWLSPFSTATGFRKETHCCCNQCSQSYRKSGSFCRRLPLYTGANVQTSSEFDLGEAAYNQEAHVSLPRLEHPADNSQSVAPQLPSFPADLCGFYDPFDSCSQLGSSAARSSVPPPDSATLRSGSPTSSTSPTTAPPSAEEHSPP